MQICLVDFVLLVRVFLFSASQIFNKVKDFLYIATK